MPAFRASPCAIRLAAGVIVFAVLAANVGTFAVPFLLDDVPAITENPTIRQLWPTWPALSPPSGGGTVTGRPLLNLSLAVNYAFGGKAVCGYHAFNLAMHILASLTLLGIVRRTLLLKPDLRARFGAAALPLALFVALIWAIHPLQTESVTYVVQRAESLMGLFYLLTLYFFIRGTESRPSGWHSLTILACLLGMATKEVMVSAPLMVLFYDRTFVAGTFSGALRQRWRVYAGLGGSWLLLAGLVANAGELASHRAGFHATITSWSYALTQLWAVPHYVWLSVWPHPLVFDYGSFQIARVLPAVPSALVLLLLVAGTAVSVWRWPAVGFLGCWFFAILAPTSSVLALAGQTVAEHRMYLPLAAVAAMVVLGVYAWLGRGSLLLFLTIAAVLGLLTFRRNQDYRSEMALWSDTVAKRPDNARARNNLGSALIEHGEVLDGIGHLESALRLDPAYVQAHYNLGCVLFRMGEVSRAIGEFEQALRLKPDFAEAHFNLGNALARLEKVSEAVVHYEQALRVKPDYAEAQKSMATALLRVGRVSESIGHYEKALRLDPDSPELHNNFGVALLQLDRKMEAIACFEQAIRLKPAYAEARNNLGVVLFQTGGMLARQGRWSDAIQQYQRSVQMQPGSAQAYDGLGVALSHQGRFEEAARQYQQALALEPALVSAQKNLALLLAACPDDSIRDGARAAQLAEKANELAGGREAGILDALAAALAEEGRFADAVKTAQRAIESARSEGAAEAVREIQGRLELYRAGRAYRQQSTTAP